MKPDIFQAIADPVRLDLTKGGKGFSRFSLISEGKEPLVGFAVETVPVSSDWSYVLPSRGGFIIQFIK